MLTVVLRGLGQVMFQRNAVTGLLFLAGMAIASPWLAAGAAVGAIIGPIVAALLNLGRSELEDGIYGYNSALVGAAAAALLPVTPLSWALAVGGAAAAAALTWLLRLARFPTYTAAFVLVTWGMVLVAGLAGDRPPQPATMAVPKPGMAGFAEEVLAGVAEVMFSTSSISGLCFLAGIAVSSWRQAVVALFGAVLGTLGAMYHGDPSGPLALGMYGFNAALAAMAVFLVRPSLVPAALAALASVPLVEFFPLSTGLPSLTAPFIMAAWLVLALGAIDAVLCQRAP
jgi:urea transporter